MEAMWSMAPVAQAAEATPVLGLRWVPTKLMLALSVDPDKARRELEVEGQRILAYGVRCP
jgi:hypothetical protein